MHRKGVKEFCKAQVSAIIATALDFLTTAIAFKLSGYVLGSTALGAVVGGSVNCLINYRWTFPNAKRKKRSIAWRYLQVWIGSAVLNSFGTDYAVRLCHPWAEDSVMVVMVCKALVAVSVAICWNYTMQKYYVFREAEDYLY